MTARSTPAVRASVWRVLSAGSVGALAEWYDFAVYAYLATLIADLFFPKGNETTALLGSLAVFAVGFVFRPVGGLIFGHFGDRFGRRNALAVSIIVMAAATLVIAVLPTYDQAGVLAPVLLVAARIVQGIAAGGEWGGGTTFLVEFAPPGRKGLYGSLHQVATIGGFVLGIAVSMTANTVLSAGAMHSFGWRLPFVVGALGAIVGLYLRLRITETPDFRAIADVGEVVPAPVVRALTRHLAAVLTAVGVVIGWTIAYYALIGMPSFIAGIGGVPLTEALVSNLIAMVVHLLLLPVFGALSDKVGYRPLLFASMAGIAVVTYPVYALVATGEFGMLVLGQVIFSVVLAVFSGPAPAALAQLFPPAVRYTSLSVGYNFATAIFGGSAPFVITFLAARTGSDLASAFYVIAGALVTAVVLLVRRTERRAR